MSTNLAVVDKSQIRDLTQQEIDSTSGGSPFVIAVVAVLLLAKCQEEITKRAAQRPQQ